MMVEGPLPSGLLQRREKPTFYLPDALPQPVWASASSQLSVKKNIEESSSAVKGGEGQAPGMAADSSTSLSNKPSDSTAPLPASGSSYVHQLQSSHSSMLHEAASVEGREGALPAPVSVPIIQPDFEDVISNGEGSDFQDAHSEGVCLHSSHKNARHGPSALRSDCLLSFTSPASSPSSSQEDRSTMEDGMRKLSMGQEPRSSSSSSASPYWCV